MISYDSILVEVFFVGMNFLVIVSSVVLLLALNNIEGHLWKSGRTLTWRL